VLIAQPVPPETGAPAWTALWQEDRWVIGVTIDPGDPSPDRDELMRILNGLVWPA
jgi:hypothetical protein